MAANGSYLISPFSLSLTVAIRFLLSSSRSSSSSTPPQNPLVNVTLKGVLHLIVIIRIFCTREAMLYSKSKCRRGLAVLEVYASQEKATDSASVEA